MEIQGKNFMERQAIRQRLGDRWRVYVGITCRDARREDHTRCLSESFGRGCLCVCHDPMPDHTPDAPHDVFPAPLSDTDIRGCGDTCARAQWTKAQETMNPQPAAENEDEEGTG
jgi:hypothetical protein